MSEGEAKPPWEAVQALEASSKDLSRHSSHLQALWLDSAANQRTQRLAEECKVVIRRMLEHFSSGQVAAHVAECAEALGERAGDMLDDILERADASLDRARALLKAARDPGFGSGPSEAAPALAAAPVAGVRAGPKAGKSSFQAAHMDFSMGPRPQDSFHPSVDNSNEPFRPQLQPWQASLPGCFAADNEGPPGLHPLQRKGLDETPLTYIDTQPALESLAQDLASAHEIAVDLEAHAYRSFQGFCCLMQLSTRQADYLVDVLALRSAIGPVLGPIFADDQVLKVLHGADSDIVWLQRDFGIYVTNLFDTGQAARVLGYPSAGLAYLLSRFCRVKADKRWQMADWRIRPLSEEALLYARMDTHYLLYMYDLIKVELASVPRVPDHLHSDLPATGPATMIGVVLERSRRLCMQQYHKELLAPGSYLDAFSRCQDRLTRQQLAVFAGLFAWRDRVARERDESTGFVMPKVLLMKLSRSIPRTTQDLLKLLGHSGKRSSPLLSELAAEVVQVIGEAAQNLDSVPEPDEAMAKLKHARTQNASAQTSSPALGSAAAATASAQSVDNEAVGTDTTDAARAPAANASGPAITGEHAAPMHQSSNGSIAIAKAAAAMPDLSRTGTAKGAAMPPVTQPKAGALRPKQLPLLTSDPQRSGGLFRPQSTLTGLLGQQGPAYSSASLPQQPAPAAPPAGAASAEAAEPPAAAASLRDAETMQQPDSSAGVGQLSLQQEGTTVRPQQQSLTAQATGLGALLGCSRMPRSGAGVAMASVSSAARRPGHSTGKAATLAGLRAQLTLPFVGGISAADKDKPKPQASGMPDTALEAQIDLSKTADSHKPEGENGNPMQKASGADVRAVMDDIVTENRFQALSAPRSSAQPVPEKLKEFDDFLPLPISEEYQLPSKRRRRADQSRMSDVAQAGALHDEAGMLAAQQAALKQAGLDDSDSGGSAGHEQMQANPQGKGHGVEREQPGQTLRRDVAGLRKARKQSLRGRAGAGPAGHRPLGPVFPREPKLAQSQKPGELKRPQAAQLGSTALSTFDYTAAKAAATGLDMAAMMGLPAKGYGDRKSAPVHGGRNNGRTGRAEGSDKLPMGKAGRQSGQVDKKRKGFDPYSSFEAHEIKGGKSSRAMHKAGNRSMAFR